MPDPEQPPIVVAVTVEVAKLELKAGDILYLRVPDYSPEQCRQLMWSLSEYMHQVGKDGVIVIAGDFEITKVLLSDEAVDQVTFQVMQKLERDQKPDTSSDASFVEPRPASAPPRTPLLRDGWGG